MAQENPYNIKPTFPDKYYVYALCKPNGDVFYVGKGKGKRINCHFQEYHLKRSNSAKNQTIRKYGNAIKREILCYFDNESSAYDYEEWLISYYGLESDGGCLRQYAKTRYEYSDKFSKEIASKASAAKTDKETEELVLNCYKLYFTDCENKHFISQEFSINYDTLRSWLNGSKHKILYEKYVKSGLVVKNREYSKEFKLDKRINVSRIREMRDLWLGGKITTGDVAKEFNIDRNSIREMFYGITCKGLFKNYEIPQKYKRRKNKSKWLEDKTC